MIKLYLIDDHQFILDGISRIMEPYEDIQIIGQTTDPVGAIHFLSSSEDLPDIVICDLTMPAIRGNELLAKVRLTLPHQKFIILTMHDDRDNVVAIADAGAEGYVLKSSNPKIFTDAIRRVFDGGTYYSSEVIHHLFKAAKKEKEVLNELKAFTEREIEILKLVLKEKTSHEIAEELFISKQTVDTHRKNILHKSNEHNLIGLVKFGLRNGLLEV